MLTPGTEPAPGEGSEADKLQERFRGVLSGLEAKAREWAGRKQPIEQRWLEDLRQYHGHHDEETQKRLLAAQRKGQPRSSAFINQTRPKTNAMSAKLMDMLFPTDEKAWAIEPTPVPELVAEAEQAVEAARKARTEAMLADQDGADPAAIEAVQQKASALDKAANDLKARQDEARGRAMHMEREIEDALVQCRWPSEARDVIEDACRMGAGVVEGPVLNDRVRARWVSDGAGGWVMEHQSSPKPALRRVSPWDFFPDPDARTIHEASGCFVRHVMTKRTLRRLALLPGVDPDAVRRLLQRGPQEQTPAYIADLRNISGEQQAPTEPRYVVWRYVGALEPEDVRTLAEGAGDAAMAGLAGELDPLAELPVVVLFCDGELLRIDPYPLDAAEPLFHIFRLEADEATVWGYGIPWMIRSPQRVLNAAWRAMMDNAGVAAGPQVVRSSKAKTEDGTNELRPWQVWTYDDQDPTGSGRKPVDLLQPSMNQEPLANIITMAMQIIDQMVSMPTIQQGEQDSNTPKTVGGMALLMSAGNVVFRRIVRSWDDDVSVPAISGLYHWHMQHSPKGHLKGDHEVKALGSSVLLVRELQTQNLAFVMSNFGDDPDIDVTEVKRAFFRSLLMNADTFVRSPEQRDEWMKRQQAEQGPTDADLKGEEIEVRRGEVDAKIAIAQMEAQSRLEEARLRHEASMMALAEARNMKIDEISADLRKAREASASAERKLAAEIGMARMTGTHSGGAV